MAASVQSRQQARNFGTVMENRKDDDLALFHELENRSIEKNEFLLAENNDFGDHIGIAAKQDRSLIFKPAITVPPRRTGVDAFLNSENDKADYDWLLTPPDTPLFPSLDMEQNYNVANQIAISNSHSIVPGSKHARLQTQPSSKNNESFKPLISSTSSNRRPSSSGGPTKPVSRPATPTSRASLPTIKKPTSRPSTPTSRPTLPAATKPVRSSTPTLRSTIPSSTKSTRPSTPTSRASIPASTKPNRPSTPTSRASRPSTPTSRASRPSTPTSRASIPSTTKPNRPSTPTSRASRPSTPTSRASLPATTKPSRPSTPTSRPTLRSSTPTKSSSGPKVVKNPAPSRGSSPTVKSRPSKDTNPNFKTTLPSARSSSNGRTRQPSNGFSVLAMSRGHSMNGDDVNPGLMGTKMVERVVNMRKLVPPKQDDYLSNNSLGKTISSQDNLGRTLSKTSLDMALRHMDITKRISGNIRPLVTNIPASSVYSVRSGPTKSKTISSSDSPLATSSTASSEPSVNNSLTFLDGIEVEDNNFRNEREKSSPVTE